MATSNTQDENNNTLSLNEAWFDKYKPKKLQDLVCHMEHYDDLKKWLYDFDGIKKQIDIKNKTTNTKKIKTTKQKKKPNILDTIVAETKNNKFLDNLEQETDEISEEYNEYEDPDDIECQVTTRETKKPGNNRVKKNKIHANLLVKGKHGVGKTVSITVMLESLNYEIQNINLHCMLDKIIKKDQNENESVNIQHKKLEKYLQKVTKSSNVMNNVMNNVINTTKEKNTTRQSKRKLKGNDQKNTKNQQKVNKKVVILIDELEIITSTNEKKIILELLKINNEKMYCPIVLISNEKHNKLVNEVIKLSLTIKFNIPHINQLNQILINVVIDNKMKITKDALNLIVQHSQNDIRRLILIIQDIYYAYEKNTITTKKMETYLIMTCKKETDPTLFEAADSLIYNYKNMFDALKYYTAEKVMLPLMIHYNYVDYVIDKYPDVDNQFNIALEVSNSLCQGDIIENYIYNDQQWDLQNIHGIYSCVLPSYLLNVNDYPKAKYYPKLIYQSSFSTDLHKTSAKKQNIKKMSKLNKTLNNVNVNDCIFINKLLEDSVKNNKVEEIIELLNKDYDIKYENIDLIHKIDKLFANKKTFDTKTQNKIKIVTQENKNKDKMNKIK